MADVLRKQLNIVLVDGIDEQKLDRIARLTQTVTVRDISIIDH